MSLDGPGSQQAMKTAVDTAVNSGVVVVVAGGNSNSDACNFSPAFVPSTHKVKSVKGVLNSDSKKPKVREGWQFLIPKGQKCERSDNF